MLIIFKTRVIFLCTHNSARSQIAEAYLNKFYGNKYKASSAGTHPTTINPYVLKIMQEEGIDLRNAKSKNVEEFLDQEFDIAITLCDDARENCPVFPSEEYGHQGFPDPLKIVGTKKEIIDGTREIRDQIKKWIITRFSNNHN